MLQSHFFVDVDSSDYLADEIRFINWLRDFEDNQDELRNICLLEVEARLRRFVFKLEFNNNETNIQSHILGEGDLNNVEKMAIHIAQNFTEQLTTDDIAASVNLHPNYAMRLFRNAFGKTMIDYITES